MALETGRSHRTPNSGRVAEHFTREENGVRFYSPTGKGSMIQGGIGSVRFKSLKIEDEECWLSTATSDGYCHSGVPLAMPDRLLRLHGVQTGNVFSITGLVRFLPDSLEPQFRHWIRVPHILLHVDKIELSRHSDDPVRVTPTVFFSQEDNPAHAEGEKGNVTYATCRDDRNAEISEAADWLAWYAEKFHGEIITNFDQQSPIFQDAPFSLQNLWAGRIRKETLDRFGFEESEELVGAVMRIIKRSTGPTYQISGGTVAIGPGAQAITNTAGKDQAMTTASWVFGSVLARLSQNKSHCSRYITVTIDFNTVS